MDIVYCSEDCEMLNCLRNKANIPVWDIQLHSWARREDLGRYCPLNNIEKETDHE